MLEQKEQKLKEYQREYQKNYNEAKKLLSIMHKRKIKRALEKKLVARSIRNK